ncbi:hypothetical protein QBE54_01010 [Thermatribacter velox]|uniref:Uncharacterized protein n=1 Tax=Thermatribacter velox TaxID=3039681 RepID=A0ABZ2YBG9_9BACT
MGSFKYLYPILKRLQKTLGASLELLEKGINSQKFDDKLWEIMPSTDKDISRVALKVRSQEIYQEKARREGFKAIRKNDPRNIPTLFKRFEPLKDLTTNTRIAKNTGTLRQTRPKSKEKIRFKK